MIAREDEERKGDREEQAAFFHQFLRVLGYGVEAAGRERMAA